MEVTDMVIRNKEYYNQLNAEVKNDLRTLNYHIRQAERYKHIHELTKGRSGLYALIHKWAERNNHFHCNAGLKLGKSNLVWLLYEMTYLQDYIQQKEEEP